MSGTQAKKPFHKTPKRPSVSIKHDVVNASDYMKYKMPWACEDCTHFNPEKVLCTIGYNTKWHLRDAQKKSFELSGRIALCRFQEID